MPCLDREYHESWEATRKVTTDDARPIHALGSATVYTALNTSQALASARGRIASTLAVQAWCVQL
jgi:hypothetical protein